MKKHKVTAHISEHDTGVEFTRTFTMSKPDLRPIHGAMVRLLGRPEGVTMGFGEVIWTFENGSVTLTGDCVRHNIGYRSKT
jgi:hypothetical protein